MTIPDEEAGQKCEFKTYRHNLSKAKDGKVPVEVLTKPFEKFAFTDEDSTYALVINRFLGEKKDTEGVKVTLKVNSKYLQNVFREVIGSYSTAPFDFTSSFTLESPFQILFHYWEELDERRQSTDDVNERMHLNLLFDFMEHEIGPDRDQIQSMARKNQIKFLNAWCIFRPGDLMFTEFLGCPQLLRCEKTAYEASKARGPFLEVHCIYTDHDGTDEGESKTVLRIYQKKSFGAENPAVITDLPVYPRRFVQEGDSLEARLRQRGRKFLELRGVQIQQYDGMAQFLKEPDLSYFDPDMADFAGVWLPYAELGRVIFDRKTFQEDQYSDAPQVRPTEVDPVLCPPYAFGFSLSRKEWGRFLIDFMQEVEWKEDVWKSLILKERQKRILQSLVMSHNFPENARDQTHQKGRGLVVLLHGSPGSGKTLTAETAAEGTKRALMMTSLGELNKWDTAWSFEIRLKLLLRYATMWKAVVLMDEADVFLEARDSGDNTTRNALVAVFLKELEYFGGIVFLTTNRITSFDRAMKSRIHLALEYTPPGIETRQSLWIQILKSIPGAEIGFDPEDAVDSFVGVKMNGREIANAIHTARTIARFDQKPLALDHIDMVLDVRREFYDSLKKTAKTTGHSGDKSVRMLIGRTSSIIEEDGKDFTS